MYTYLKDAEKVAKKVARKVVTKVANGRKYRVFCMSPQSHRRNIITIANYNKGTEKSPNSSDLATRVLAQWTGSDRLLKFASHSFFFWSCYYWSVI